MDEWKPPAELLLSCRAGEPPAARGLLPSVPAARLPDVVGAKALVATEADISR